MRRLHRRTRFLCAIASSLPVLLGAATLGCPSRDRPPPEVPGVELGRLTTEELDLYRRILSEEVSPCGGGQTLDVAIRGGGCSLAPWAARFVAHRVEENDSREEVAERYLERYGASRRQEIPTEGAPATGDPEAPVTVVVFSDFICPHCARAARALRELAEEDQGRVRLVFHTFPLFRVRASGLSAVAALAADRQGRFWELHDLLYDNQRSLDQQRILALAEETGVDMEQLRDDLLDPAVEARVRAGRELGETLGVRGTPTIFINGRMYDDPLSRLEWAIEEELARLEMNRAGAAPSKTLQEPDRDAD